MATNSNVNDIEKPHIKDLYKTQKKELTRLTRISKKENWKRVYSELEDDIWGNGYKIATQELRNIVPYDIPLNAKRAIISDLVPQRDNIEYSHRSTENIQMFIEEEFKQAANGKKSGRARGNDDAPGGGQYESFMASWDNERTIECPNIPV